MTDRFVGRVAVNMLTLGHVDTNDSITIQLGVPGSHPDSSGSGALLVMFGTFVCTNLLGVHMSEAKSVLGHAT